MTMTMTQKLLAHAAGVSAVCAGELILCPVSLVLGNDITTPMAIREFQAMGATAVFDKSKIALVPDHFTPNKDIASAVQAKEMREFARAHEIQHYFEVGRMGVEHALLPEMGLVAPGEVIIGADSHTCTYGAVGAFATGVGSTDMAAGMATGRAWLRVPSAIKVILTGQPGEYVTGKDIILHLIGLIGVDGARYQSLEFTGDGIKHLTMDSRLSMCNMAVEAGAKNGIFPVDAVTKEYLQGRVTRPWQAFEPDADAAYERTVEIDLAQVPLTVSFPHLPENARPAAEAGNVPVNQVVIGSCTNGRMEDLRVAADILRGRSVHPDVRLIVIPATQKIYRQAMEEGLLGIFIEAGAAVSTPSCGPCLGGHLGVLAPGERCVATTNRNFVGRMGHPDSEVYLASPAVAAASAVLGRIGTPGMLGQV